MKGTSTYARKRAQQPPAQQPRNIFNVMARFTPYNENSFYDPKEILLKVHLALRGYLDRTTPSDDTNSYDELAAAFGEAEVRYREIGGHDNNPALPILNAGNAALTRMRERWERLDEWGLDGLGITQLKDAVGAFEDVLMVSSPQQMHNAAMTRYRYLKSLAGEK